MMFNILVNKSNKLCLVILFEQILYIHTQKAKMCQIEGFIKQLFFKLSVYRRENQVHRE